MGNGDAIILLREMLAPDSLTGLRVYFPDPWPKKRHHKRRLIQPEFLTLAATRLAPGAVLHCATDWEPYAEQMLEVLTAHPDFENTVPGGGFAPRPAHRPLTRFEGQGLDKGHVVNDLLFRRVQHGDRHQEQPPPVRVHAVATCPPYPTNPPRPHWWQRGWVRYGALTTLLAISGLVILALVREQTGTQGFLVGLGLAVLPVPLLIAAFRWLDRVEPGPGGIWSSASPGAPAPPP